MSIRIRLAIWYGIALAVVIVLLGVAVRAAVERQLQQDVDSALVQPAQEVAAELEAQKGLPWFDRSLYLPLVQTFKDPGEYIQLDDAKGGFKAGSATLQGDQLPRPRSKIGPSGAFTVEDVNGAAVRLYTLPLVAGRHLIGYVQVGKSLHDERLALQTLTIILVLVGTAAIVLSSLVAWLLAGWALKPLASMTRAARSIALSRKFGERLPEPRSRDELGTLASTFNDVLSSLDQAHAVQRRFLADASHELRTPLTALEANLDYLAMAPDAPAEERKDAFQAARQAVKRMGRLVHGLLYLARMEAGQEVQHRPVELDQIVVSAYKEVKPLANGVQTALASVDEAVVLGDPDRLQQLLLILLDNALKYTPSGGSVSVALIAQDGWATISVQDTGIGISDKERERIFRRFYRSQAAAGHYAEGSGLGLAIADQIVESHHGRIDVTSAPGKGSTFTIALPICREP